MILPEQDGSYLAACEREGCDWSFGVASEDLAATMDAQHAERHLERDALAESIALAGQAAAYGRVDGHQHGPQCTQESCPGARYHCQAARCLVDAGGGRWRLDCQGHDVPSRAQLVGMTTRRRAQPVVARRAPATSQPDEIPF